MDLAVRFSKSISLVDNDFIRGGSVLVFCQRSQNHTFQQALLSNGESYRRNILGLLNTITLEGDNM